MADNAYRWLLPLLLWSFQTVAHDFWIDPSRYRFGVDEILSLTLREGPRFKGNSVPYIDALVRSFRLYDGQREYPIEAQLGDDPAALIDHQGQQGLAIAYRSHGSFVELKPAKFLSYLGEEGLDYILPELKRRGLEGQNAREFFVRCAKTLIRDKNGSTRKVFSHRFGMPLELIPIRDPYGAEAAEELPLMLLFEGKPVDGVSVVAILKGASRAPEAVRTHNGSVVMRLDEPGEWLIKAVHMVSDTSSEADWISYWASITLKR